MPAERDRGDDAAPQLDRDVRAGEEQRPIARRLRNGDAHEDHGERGGDQ